MPSLLFLISILGSAVLILSISLFFNYRSYKKSILEHEKVIQALRKINKIILEELDFEKVAQKVADAIPIELKFATGVVAIFDEGKQVIRRVAASQTTEAIEAIRALRVPFSKIEIPVNDPNNLMAKAIRDKKPFMTQDVYDVLGPILNKEEAEKIQQIMSTKTTLVYPLYMENKPIGVFVASTKKDQSELSSYELEILQEFVEGAAIALQHAILYKLVNNQADELKNANKRLQELDKLKDDFVSIASHELRTPMTAIRSYVWMAINRPDIPLSPKLEKYLGRTLVSTERLINLVNDMLNVSRIEAGSIEINPSPFDIVALVKDVVEEVKVKADEKHLTISVLEHSLPPVFADADKVHQVLLNLTGNAIKFCFPSGAIVIDFFVDKDMIEVSVKDGGPGISKEDLSKLFNKFSRLDSSYVAVGTSGGTGLGLYISKSLVELMHGRIWAASEGVGKGATFSFSVPTATKELIAQADKFHIKPQGEVKGLEPVAI